MSKSTLSQVLAAFEENRGPVTLAQIARKLDLSQVRLEGMIQYWVRKGKLREIASFKECGSCGNGPESCPFVVELPRSYELVTADNLTISLSAAGASCNHRR
ncbi:MAG: FeoC-like transcriptional regulator [Candidatus Promineifilaceae bacterium]